MFDWLFPKKKYHIKSSNHFPEWNCSSPETQSITRNILENKDISEPVYAFERAISKDRKRFCLTSELTYNGIRWCLLDKQLNEKFEFYSDTTFIIPVSPNITFLTFDEAKYLARLFSELNSKYKDRMKEIKNIRQRRFLSRKYQNN